MRGLIVGTGPSLRGVIELIPKFDGRLFICNNCYAEPWVAAQHQYSGNRPVWLACDPKWHEHFSPVHGDFDKWHWSLNICQAYGYRYVEGIWLDGLYMGPGNKISLNHCSGAQLLNLAAGNQYACSEIILVGHDFHYQGNQRHYFDDLSDLPGEYPEPLRKYSEFDKRGKGNDLLNVYRHIAEQDGLPPIINCTPGSKLPWFPYEKFERFTKPIS